MATMIARVPMSRAEFDQRSAYLKMENAKWGSQMEPVPESHWPRTEPRPVAVFRSRLFLAQVFAPANGGQRISVCRTEITREGDWRADIGWEELMQVKDGCGFAEHWAAEIFPPNSEVVNVANLRHIWIIEQPIYAWHK
jgi:hypothetical protein